MADPDDEGGEGAGADGGQGADGGAGGVDGQELRQAIREVLAEMGVGSGGAGAGGTDGGDQGAGGGTGTPAAGGRLIDQEAHFEGIVRNVLEDLKTREDVTSLKEEVRKIVERPPRKYRKVTERLWGGGDE